MGMKTIVLACVFLSLLSLHQGKRVSRKKDLLKHIDGYQEQDRDLRLATGGTGNRGAYSKSGRMAAIATKRHGKNVDLPQDVCKYKDTKCDETTSKSKYRTADGSCNNLFHRSWGMKDTPQRRCVAAEYGDGISKPRTRNKGRTLPSARLVSRTVHTADSNSTFAEQFTHMLMQWGQFLDHDITLTPTQADETTETCCPTDQDETTRGQKKSTCNKRRKRPECFPIPIPDGDSYFTDSCMNFVRSILVPNMQCKTGALEQLNGITAYIDASNVYGSSEEEQTNLREMSGGRLKSSDNDLLPQDSAQSCTNTSAEEFCFKAGDGRVNEQPGLAGTHTLFIRHHNMIAGGLARINSHWDEGKLFEETRRIVGAHMQHITFKEFLPIVIGNRLMDSMGLQPTEQGHANVYDATVDAGILNEFSTAAFRFGHSLIRGSFSRLFRGTNSATALSDAFFRPIFISEDNGAGLNRVTNGLRKDMCQDSDRFFTTEVTNKLFEVVAHKGFDLVALNIQRGRDHGIPSYNAIRAYFGLDKAESFTSGEGGFINHTPEAVEKFREVYDDPDDVDFFSGGISEEKMEGAFVGPTFANIISKQFANLKFGDRFWYENNHDPTQFTLAQLNALKKVKFAKIICQNSDLNRIQPNVFKVIDASGNEEVACNALDGLDLEPWRESPPC